MYTRLCHDGYCRETALSGGIMRYFYSLTAHVAAVLWCRRILINNRHLPFKCPQWWNVTKYIYSSIRPKQKKKMSLSILCSFTLQLYIWEGNIRLFTPLHLTVLVPGYSLGWPTSHAKQTIWNSFFWFAWSTLSWSWKQSCVSGRWQQTKLSSAQYAAVNLEHTQKQKATCTLMQQIFIQKTLYIVVK